MDRYRLDRPPIHYFDWPYIYFSNISPEIFFKVATHNNIGFLKQYNFFMLLQILTIILKLIFLALLVFGNNKTFL